MSKIQALSYLFVLALISTLLTGSAGAASITIYGTGQTNSGSGQSDPNYQLLSAPAGVTSPGPAYTGSYSAWISAPPGFYWDNPFNPLSYGPYGRYDYQTTFDLTGLVPGTAVLTGISGCDDGGSIWLNGVQVATMGSIAAFTPFTITNGLNGSSFLPGVNTLDFIIDNTLDNSPTGLMVAISGTANPVPEPGSMALLSSGVVVALGGLGRKFRA